DTVNPRTLHPHTGAHRINAVVIGFHGHFGALSRQPHDLLDRDQSVFDFRYFLFHQFGQEEVVRAGNDDDRVVVLHLHALDNGADHIPFFEIVPADHLRPGQDELIVGGIIEHQDLPPQDLLNLTENELTLAIFIPLENLIFHQLHHPGHERLTGCHSGPAAKYPGRKLLIALILHLIALVDKLGLRHRTLALLIHALPVRHDLPDPPQLQVTVVVDDDVKVL